MRSTHSIALMKLAWDVVCHQRPKDAMDLVDRISDEIPEPPPVKKGDLVTIHWDLGSFTAVAWMESYPESSMWCVSFGPDEANRVAMWNGEQWQLGFFGKDECLDLTVRPNDMLIKN